jgi:ArsR family transcriptional regulator
MNESQAIIGFSALAQETRLRILRLLVQAGPAGRAAGNIALAMDASPSNISFHLKELERAGLIGQRREARSIIYSAEYRTVGDLIGFLMQDCCAGHPEICAPALATPCCPPATKKSKTTQPKLTLNKSTLKAKASAHG